MRSESIFALFEAYSNSRITRRQLFDGLARVTGGVAAAAAFLPIFKAGKAAAEITSPDDERLLATKVFFPTHTGKMAGYLAKPKSEGKLPAVLVIHENRGLNAHIEDVARRIALEGFLAFAPDALSHLGGTPPDQEQAIAMIKNLDMAETIQNFTAAAAYLKTHPQSTGRVGVVGFCWGGALANSLAVNCPDITAAVPYYGMQPPTEDVARIKSALLLHYAALDERINKGIPALKEALDKNKVEYEMFMYEGADHAFNNDTNPARYNKQAAELAWHRTIDFLNRKLKLS